LSSKVSNISECGELVLDVLTGIPPLNFLGLTLIRGNMALSFISATTILMPALRQVSGLSVADTGFLFMSFPQLTTILGNFAVQGNSQLTNVFLPSLTMFSGSLVLACKNEKLSSVPAQIRARWSQAQCIVTFAPTPCLSVTLLPCSQII
jgi:hypothetical protein